MANGIYGYTGTYVFVTISTTGWYDITAYGAQGGGYGFVGGGLGAEVYGEIMLTAGEVLSIIVGGQGKNGTGPGTSGGGGGATVIAEQISPGNYAALFIAGGGGGSGGPGQTTINGQGGYGGTAANGAGGINGFGAGGGQTSVSGQVGGGGGGGFYGSGGGGYGTTSGGGGGTSLLLGGAGGAGGILGAGGTGGAGGLGGGGGGGSGGGGGGGASGGGGGSSGGSGGGGGSFVTATATNVSMQQGYQPGNGGVILLAVCFLGGTNILTVNGEVAVEDLVPGDLVATQLKNDIVFQPVKWVGHRRIDLQAHPRPETVTPVRICRGAFADNVPHRDLLVSPDHAIFCDGNLICARQLVNGTTIYQDDRTSAAMYFHVELDNHAILLAEGLTAESYLDTGNRGFFRNGNEPLVLHPDLTDAADLPAREAASCAPFVYDEANVRPVWERLAARAASLGMAPQPLQATADPDLHVVANGRKLRPLVTEAGHYQFVLPADATEVRLISRAAAPTDAQPWLEDRRQLGVYVERIVVHGASDAQEIPVDHPDLATGWWAVEGAGPTLRRWTDGAAVLPLPQLERASMLEIRASSGGVAYPDRGQTARLSRVRAA